MANLAGALRECIGKTIVVNVAVKSNTGNLVNYTGTLKETGDDYILLIQDSVGDRYIALGAIVSFYERKEQDVSVITETPPRATLGPKLF